MEIRVVAVGRVKERGLREMLEDYYGRIQRYAKLREIEIPDASANEVLAKIEKAIPDRARVVALEVEGEPWSSPRVARFLAQAENDATPSLVFLVGGAYGLPKEARARANVELSLSAMTLPHRIARLVLAEQIYRGFTILRGEPYSH